MKSTLRFALFSFLGLVCVVATILWYRSHSLARDQKATLRTLQHQCDASEARLASLSRDLNAMRAETKAVSEQPSLKLQREHEQWISRLQVHIDSLKEKRRLHPLPKRPLPPPVAANGEVFPELMANPEYYALAKRLYRSMEDIQNRPSLAFLKELPAEVREKTFDLLAERSLSYAEAQGMVAEKSGGLENAAPEEYMRVSSEIQKRVMEDLKTLLSPADVAKIQEYFHPSEATIRASGNRLGEDMLTSALRTRLSYTDAPLSADFSKQLSARIQSIPVTSETRFGYNKIPSFIVEHYKALLSPGQALALEDIVAEKDAFQRREKLPKQ